MTVQAANAFYHGLAWQKRLPAGWQILPLKRIAALRSGSTITADEITEDGMYPVFGGNGFRGHTTSYTHDGAYALIGRQGALCGNVNVASGKFWASEHAIVPTPSRPVSTTWLAAVLEWMDLGQYSMSAAQPGISSDVIGRIPIPVPAFQAQQAIARFLNAECMQIDDLVAKQERLIKLLAEKRQAAITHAVTTGLDPTAPTKPSGIPWLGDINASWPVRPLKAAGEINLGKMVQPNAKTETDLEAPYLRAANVQPDGVLALDDVKKMWFNDGELESLDIRSGDVVVVEGGIGGFGRAAYVNRDLAGFGYQNSINRIRPTNSVDGRFLTYLLLTARHYGYIHAYCTGVSMPHLTAEKLAAISVPLPDRVTQTKISDHLDTKLATLNALADKASAVIGILHERRSALISAAVTGKIDIGSS